MSIFMDTQPSLQGEIRAACASKMILKISVMGVCNISIY